MILFRLLSVVLLYINEGKVFKITRKQILKKKILQIEPS